MIRKPVQVDRAFAPREKRDEKKKKKKEKLIRKQSMIYRVRK